MAEVVVVELDDDTVVVERATTVTVVDQGAPVAVVERRDTVGVVNHTTVTVTEQVAVVPVEVAETVTVVEVVEPVVVVEQAVVIAVVDTPPVVVVDGPPGFSDPISFSASAAADLSGHRAVTPDVTGAVDYADPATIANQPVWVTTQAAVAGGRVTVVAYGKVTEPSWAWTPGNVYLAADGVLTQAEPTSGALVIVGAATSPTSLFVDRNPTIDL